MIEPLRTRSLFGPLVAVLDAGLGAALCTALGACGAAPPPPPQAPAADAGAKLNLAAQARTELTAQLAKAPPDILVYCQNHAGDCLISLAERREELVKKHYLNACRESDPEKLGPCVARELEKSGQNDALASLYETENWCSRKLLECMTDFSKDAERMAIRERTQDRRAQVEAAPESAAAQRAPEFAKESLAFVRSILPPKGQVECAPSTPEACEKRLTAPSADFEAELVKPPAAYDLKRTLIVYEALKRAEADCSTPELSCLLEQLQQYGGSAETDKLLKQNLDLLKQQQSIREGANPDAAEQCLSTGVTQHSDRIVSAYQAYAAAPANYALLRLQKAFIAMHQTQLWCLMPLRKPSKR